MRKLTNQQEKFAELVANGGSYSDAHREAYPKSRDWKDKTVNENASRLYSKVYARVEEIKAALAKKNLVFPTPVGMNRTHSNMTNSLLSVPHTRGDEPSVGWVLQH